MTFPLSPSLIPPNKALEPGTGQKFFQVLRTLRHRISLNQEPRGLAWVLLALWSLLSCSHPAAAALQLWGGQGRIWGVWRKAPIAKTPCTSLSALFS